MNQKNKIRIKKSYCILFSYSVEKYNLNIHCFHDIIMLKNSVKFRFRKNIIT